MPQPKRCGTSCTHLALRLRTSRRRPAGTAAPWMSRRPSRCASRQQTQSPARSGSGGPPGTACRERRAMPVRGCLQEGWGPPGTACREGPAMPVRWCLQAGSHVRGDKPGLQAPGAASQALTRPHMTTGQEERGPCNLPKGMTPAKQLQLPDRLYATSTDAQASRTARPLAGSWQTRQASCRHPAPCPQQCWTPSCAVLQGPPVVPAHILAARLRGLAPWHAAQQGLRQLFQGRVLHAAACQHDARSHIVGCEEVVQGLVAQRCEAVLGADQGLGQRAGVCHRVDTLQRSKQPWSAATSRPGRRSATDTAEGGPCLHARPNSTQSTYRP